MSVDANALERETLERKDREELQKIVGALGGKATTRTRKADLIDQILELTGVTSGEAGDSAQGGTTEAAAAADGPAGDAPEKDDRSGDTDAGSGDADAGKGRAGRADAGTSDTGRSGAGRADAGRGGSAEADAGKADAGKTDSGKADTGKADAGEADSGKADAGKTESGKDANGRDETREGTSDKRDEKTDDKSDEKRADASESDDRGAPGQDDQDGGGRRRRRRGRNRETGGQQEEYTGEPIPVAGVLDLRDDGYGFLRVDGLLPSKDDCYVSVKQVRQFGLRKGDLVSGGARPAHRNEKNPAMLRIDTVNEVALEPGTERPRFEELSATFPTELLPLVVEDEPHDRTTRALDVLAPVGKGSRVLVLSPPRAGKTTLLQTIARSVEINEPDTPLLVVLLDERPEEITEMRNVVAGHAVYGSAFDAAPDEHVAVLELALARAQRMAEGSDDVVVLVDGLTRLARAAHSASQGVGRSLGGLDVAAVQTAKRCFGAGRNLAEAGSVTLVATANVDTGSEVDAAVVDGVMGAANCHIRLDGFSAARRVFPAIDVGNTSTRHEELLVGAEASEQREALRRVLAELPGDGVDDQARVLDGLLERLRSTESNDELLAAAAEERQEKSR